MAAGRARRSRRPERSTAYRQSPRSSAEVVQQAMGEAAERWIEYAKGTAQEENAQAFAEIAPIVAKHWSEILDRMWASYAKPPPGGDLLKLQRDVHLASVAQLNEMMKEVMGSKAFAAMAGTSVETYLKAKIASDRMMEETLKALRIPTKTDIDDLHSSIYSLSKKIDALAAAKPGARPSARGR